VNNRRKLLMAFGAGALAVSPMTFAQAAERHYRLGMLSASDVFIFKEPHYVAFVRRLSELGLVEGRNLSIERRHGDNRIDRLPALAAELAKLKCEVFFGGGTEATLTALTNATRDTPVVFIAVDFDPVATGHVASLARPGGRVTGVTAIQSSMPAKRLELLKEFLPGVVRVAVFTNEQTTEQLSVAQGTARRLSLQLHVVDFKRPPFDYEAGFSDAVRAKADALFVLGSGLWVSARQKIMELSRKARLPTVFHQSDWVEAGGLMSYGFNFPGMWRRGADMVASVLRGVKVSDIPMEQPTTYELAVNLRTAKALGVKIPNSILVRADKVIE
jgi:putative tryptophan/tyrosine transport system substrate-binding protein